MMIRVMEQAVIGDDDGDFDDDNTYWSCYSVFISIIINIIIIIGDDDNEACI
jgi:hypothetical protein